MRLIEGTSKGWIIRKLTAKQALKEANEPRFETVDYVIIFLVVFAIIGVISTVVLFFYLLTLIFQL